MPAIMDDPDSDPIYRVSGEPPFPDPDHPALPPSITPRQVTLRDRQTVATIVPFASQHQVPASLLLYLSDQLAKEIEKGDTYPMMEPMAPERFAPYWFQNFGAVMLLGSIDRPEDVAEGKDWSRECLGSFYIKPNYPGRSSHVCNGGFLVTDAARNRGVGRLMGESYIDWAPRLGYTYSVFNLVYETNVASCKIWDGLGFKRIGRVKGCGNLRSYPGRLIDAIIFGRDLAVGEADELLLVSEERFDKIRFYLKYGKYPQGADRAEKSRLRSAATHYKLLDGDVLMLKDKEVIADPRRQLEIARRAHGAQHAGINKTTATIAERYHWSRIKETVSDVIRTCSECKELGKAPSFPGASHNSIINSASSAASKRSAAAAAVAVGPVAAPAGPASSAASPSPSPSIGPGVVASAAAADGRTVALQEPQQQPHQHHMPPFVVPPHYASPSDISVILAPAQTLHTPGGSPTSPQHGAHGALLQAHHPPHGIHLTPHPSHHHHPAAPALPMPEPHSVYQPIDPQIITQPSAYAHHHPVHPHGTFSPYHGGRHHPTDAADADTFQALLSATDDDHGGGGGGGGAAAAQQGHQHQHLPASPHGRTTTAEDEAAAQEAMDRDLDMLIEPQDDDDDGDDDVDMGVVAGGEHDDLAKMSVGRLLSAPEPGDAARQGVGGQEDGGSAAGATGSKARGGVGVEHGTPG